MTLQQLKYMIIVAERGSAYCKKSMIESVPRTAYNKKQYRGWTGVNTVKNKFFTGKFVPAQYMLRIYESLQVVGKAWLLLC